MSKPKQQKRTADIDGTLDEPLSISRAVIAMAHELNMTVVAEGVETVEQYRFLAEQRCEFAQGYFFAKPLPAGEVDIMSLLEIDSRSAPKLANVNRTAGAP